MLILALSCLSNHNLTFRLLEDCAFPVKETLRPVPALTEINGTLTEHVFDVGKVVDVVEDVVVVTGGAIKLNCPLTVSPKSLVLSIQTPVPGGPPL